ncbi:uncharacterized protein N0V89_010144 [Didymosphaeria variabile]|uniref:WW domain-containing protein n=1 Tax=Didymosphaeria variabile TaxID=1932322 RepID=A0A9W8XEN6_9PLEO|nr:uncharacterized protein N0V89_010144 [Didymosphaeria variabile]KAJ4348766.1 hypothetical protein N0V89_010144 [Didymosphaeria variabile]
MSAPTPPRPAVSPDSGPTDAALPKLPSGWIAQWDNTSRKYYYVQISTGVSQWDLPTSEAPIGGGSHHSTPAQNTNPYNKPADGVQGPDVGDGTRGVDGPTGDRAGGLGGFAMNALMGNNKQSSHGGGSSNLVGQLASGLLGGGKQSHGGSSSGHGGGSSNLVGQLASGLLGGGKQSHGSNQSGHGGSSGHSTSSGGGLGGLLGGVLGGSSHNKPADGGYGYSHNASQGSTYSGSAPPTAYQPSGSHAATPSHNAHSSPPPGQYGSHDQHQQGGYGQHQHNQYGGAGGQHQNFPPPGQSYGSPAPGQHQQSQYGGNNQYGAPPNQHQGNYGGPPGGYGQQAGYGGPVFSPPPGQYGHNAPYGGPQNYDQHQHNQYGGAPQYPPPPQAQHSYGQQGGHQPPQPGW